VPVQGRSSPAGRAAGHLLQLTAFGRGEPAGQVGIARIRQRDRRGECRRSGLGQLQQPAVSDLPETAQ
jgi:hypothetical protein